ncbi:hypothetical protein BKP45_12375 [Anaerobacillus alkalidiazotrophicus]|uniref:Uncharacterized protein n=1 Tax=Anaerobacillus alkalidiazotrophicus TaxID=472963 RepID=A0A1S2M413_9BACI|nr:hypothetical protein [Anaerobacillus alkalidiazotrophicus]OIJ18365.1 hypothetical protein BKP45_18090 [Anaerobacillus alkalidiazotrophicus]OIJ19844.1 hypothetical protein BKP45_12375 [Anaerobacillus alkalidiazotrophicus]
MVQFIFIIIGVVFSVLIFRIFPFNVKRKYLIKVIGIAAVNVLLTFLMYSMFSLPAALGGLLVLTALFAYLVTNQEAVDTYVYKEVSEKDTEKNEQHVQQPNELNTPHIQLGQDSIDHLVQAVAVEGLESALEKEITPRLKETFTSPEENQAIKQQDEQENLEVNEYIISEPIQKIKIEGENMVHIEEPSEKISKDKEIELLGEDENRGESFEYNERIERNGTSSKDELELFFAGSTRKIMLEDEIEDHKEATEYHLPLYERSVFNEIKSEKVTELDEINKDKQYVDVEANNKQSELKESILKKRTKLFEDIEKDY